jgi:hypothetical protein
MSPQAYQGDYISDLPAVVTPATELPGGLFEVEVLTGPVAGAYVNKRLTTEQFVDYVLSQSTGAAPALTALAELADLQAELANDRAPFVAGVRYNITGDWNASGNPAQVVYVQAATANSLERVGTQKELGEDPVAVIVDIVAGTATALPDLGTQQANTQQLATLGARAANLYAHYANNSVAPFVDLDSYLAAAGANGGTLRLEGEATSLYISANNRGNWPAFWDAAGATIVVPDGLILKSSAAGLANLNFANFYLDGSTNGTGLFNLTGQLPQATSAGEASLLFNGQALITVNNDANVVVLDGGYYKKITGAGKYYLAGSVQVDDQTGASNVVDLRSGSGSASPVPDTYAVLAYAFATVLDLAGAAAQLLALSGNVSLTTTNRAQGHQVRLFLYNNSASGVALTFPSAWAFLGSKPAVLAAGKRAVLTVECVWGGAESDIVAGYVAQA